MDIKIMNDSGGIKGCCPRHNPSLPPAASPDSYSSDAHVCNGESARISAVCSRGRYEGCRLPADMTPSTTAPTVSVLLGNSCQQRDEKSITMQRGNELSDTKRTTASGTNQSAGGRNCSATSPPQMSSLSESKSVTASAQSGKDGPSSHCSNISAATRNTSSISSSVTAQSNVASAIPQKKTPKDFIFGKLIGEGSFSTVYLAKDIHTNKEYAIKVCDKRHILREKKQAYIRREKEVLNILNSHPSPFFVKLYCTFQDTDRLYFVLSYAKNGELLPYINKVGSFDEDCTRFYSAEILLALEHLHKFGIIHRDLKPENILLSEEMHVLVTDFGSAKILQQEKTDGTESIQRKNSFVGTAQYVSPELLMDKSASCKSSDLWALGCIIYQMVSGLPPFRAANEYLIFQKITKLDFEFPEGFSSRARNLVSKLLVLDPLLRLGACDACSYVSIRKHEFFGGIQWDILDTQSPPPIYPYLPGTLSNEELRSHYRVPDSLEPGLDDKQMTRLLGLDLHDDEEEEDKRLSSPTVVNDGHSSSGLQRYPSKKTSKKTSIMDFCKDGYDEKEWLAIQVRENPWHRFVEGNLILRYGLVDKRKGLFAKRRMLLLTTGPHLYYVDPVNLVLKGEIPWSPELRPEPKNFKTFFVHTPNRTYYLEDPEGYALEWCRMIDEVRKHVYRQTT